MKDCFEALICVLRFLLRCIYVSLPALLVLMVLSSHLRLKPAQYIIDDHKDELVHEILPRTRWGHLRPCGTLFDEKKEFEIAKQCVNERVWQDDPIEEPYIPRCFLISADSPDVFASPEGFNGIPLLTPFGFGMVVGVYQPETQTVFIVENEDSAQIYRHELQHFFLHLHSPITEGGGHYQDIWKQCEAPYYEPSIDVKVKHILKDYERLKKQEDEMIREEYK